MKCFMSIIQVENAIDSYPVRFLVVVKNHRISFISNRGAQMEQNYNKSPGNLCPTMAPIQCRCSTDNVCITAPMRFTQ